MTLFQEINLIDAMELLDSGINLFFTCLNQVVAYRECWRNNWPSLFSNSSMDLFNLVNLLPSSPKIKFFLCKNSKNFLLCGRKSESNSRNKIASDCSNSSQTPLTSCSAPFSKIVSNASIKKQNWVINLFEVSPSDNCLVAAALSNFSFFTEGFLCFTKDSIFNSRIFHHFPEGQ